jgi:hypothetical protein
MRRTRPSPVPWTALAVLAVALPVLAGPDAPSAGGPPVYRNDGLGVQVTGPAGWKMATAKTTPTQWSPLVTFYDPGTDTEATLHVRPRRSATVKDLTAELQKEWSADRTITVVGSRAVEPTARNAAAGVVFEATQTKPATRPEAKPGAPAPAPAAPTTWYVMATYWLGPGYEFLLYAQSRSTLWSRMRPFLEGVRDSFQLAAAARGPEGEGAYQDEARGFSCRFPKGYTVRVPARKNHVVEFAGVSADQPVLGVYHFASASTVEQDAQSLVAYYTEEQNGEATAAPHQVAASPGMLVTARANVGGKDQTFFVAIAKRGGEFFRLRAAVPRAAEAEGKRVFDAFLGTVTLGTPKALEPAGSGED